MKKKGRVWIAALILITIIMNSSWGAPDAGGGMYLKEYGYQIGWMEGSLDKQSDYEVMPFIVRYGFDITPSAWKGSSAGILEFEVEPFLSPVLGPETNLETGCNLLIKYIHPLNDRVHYYIEGGTGLLYTTQTFNEQATHLNSILQVGAGIHYFLREDFFLNIGYRFRHFSNIGFKDPNGGIDTDSVIVGFSYFY